MRKPSIDPSGALKDQMTAVREVLLIVTGQKAGAITAPKQIVVPYPSTGIAVNSATTTTVVTTAEFDLLVQKVADMEAALSALIARLNTP